MADSDVQNARTLWSGVALLIFVSMPRVSTGQTAHSSTVSVNVRDAYARSPRAVTSTSAAPFAARAEERALFAEERAIATPVIEDPLLVLKLPALLTELAFAPLIPVVLSFEKLRLHDRIFDLLTNDAKTMAFLPLIEFVNRSGFSAGAAFIRNDPLGSPDRLVAYVLMRTNLDRAMSLSYTRRLPSLSGKKIHFGAAYALDQDARYFGIGGRTQKDDERLLEMESVDVATWIEVPAPPDWNARIALAYRRRSLDTGEGQAPGVVEGGTVAPPPGFGQTLDSPEVGIELAYDSRDSAGRTTRGIVATLEGSLTHDLNGERVGGARGTAKLATFLPLLPLNRVLVLALGASAAAALGEGGKIPLQTLVSLGGSNHLRGYPSERFTDRLGWWATAEYRYEIFEYADTGNGLSATIFADLGRVGRTLEDLVKGPIGYSIGFGFRAEANLFFLARFQIAYSPEGVRLVIAVNEIL